MRDPKRLEDDFPNDGPAYDPEEDREPVILPEEIEAELRELTTPAKPRAFYGDEDQNDLMDLIDKHTD